MCDGHLNAKEQRRLMDDCDRWARRAERAEAKVTHMTEQLRKPIIDLCWAVTPFGEDEDGWITRYLVSSGPMHRLIGAAQGVGIPAAFRAIDPQQSDGKIVKSSAQNDGESDA